MKLTITQSTIKKIKADAVAVFVLQDETKFRASLRELKQFFGSTIERLTTLEDFTGKADQLLYAHTDKKIASPRLIVIGLGESSKISLEGIRRAAAAVAKRARSAKAKHLALLLPSLDTVLKEPVETIAQTITEGCLLSLYKYDKYFTEKKETNSKIGAITLFSDDEDLLKAAKKGMIFGRSLCDSVYFSRDLQNAPSNEIHPEALAHAARESGAKHGFRVTVWDKKRIDQEGFGGLMTVNAGSSRPPVFIVMEYHGKNMQSQPIVLIGKGITFDTGGISLKPSAGMAEMKMDMSGGAAVIATMEAAARLKLAINLVGLVPATENMPGGSAMKPGDVIRHYGGKTSEVDNTDAEGRLILADALAYATKYKPAAVIDLATLTGACVVALGHHATGMMGNDAELMAQLRTAGDRTFERVWELPLFEEYEKQIKSEIADVKNVGGRWAGTITAGLFLKKFIGDYKWVHLDIAGTAMLEEDLPYAPRGGSGVGVRLLVEFLKNHK